MKLQALHPATIAIIADISKSGMAALFTFEIKVRHYKRESEPIRLAKRLGKIPQSESDMKSQQVWLALKTFASLR